MSVETIVTAYQVSAVPEDEAGNYLLFTIKVERTHHTDRWAVRLRSSCLSMDGAWEYEPLPSSRDDEWLDRHRFDLKTALDLAAKAAPHVTVNGITVADVLARNARKGGTS